LRILYEHGQIRAPEADTNGDRHVDVGVTFVNGERVEQLEDQKGQGKISARYVVKGGQVGAQEAGADGEPPRAAPGFGAVEEEYQAMAIAPPPA